MTVPIVIIVALALGLTLSSGKRSGSSSTRSGPLPALTPSPPPANSATVKPCTTLLEDLPIHVGKLAPRTVHPKPDSLFVLAWGNPPVLLRCGVARPADLKPGSTAQFFQFGTAQGTGGVYFDVTSHSGDEVYTSVDRAVYVQITVPAQYHSAPVVTLANAIARALPPVCVGGQLPGGTDPSTLCTRRK